MQEAETINQCEGVRCVGDYQQCYVTDISHGDYIKVRNVDFGKNGAKSFKAKVRCTKKCTLFIRLGSKTGTAKGRITIEPTNEEWAEVSCDLTSSLTGVRDIFLTFTGSGGPFLDFDNWCFSEETTGIEELRSSSESGVHSSESYDLSGRKSTNNGKSIRIVDGKKILHN